MDRCICVSHTSDPLLVNVNEHCPEHGKQWATVTYQEYAEAIIAAAKRIQGDTFVGEEWYRETCSWEEDHEEGTDPEEVVHTDMSYWDA